MIKMIMRLFKLWNLSLEEQLELLGIEKKTFANLTHCFEDLLLESNDELFERVSFLLDIHKSLRIIFPHNLELAYLWPKKNNSLLQNKTPIEIMRKNGYIGILKIKNLLNHEIEC